MRRVHLKGRDNILKRLLVHAGGFNLALILRKLVGVGKPGSYKGLSRAFSRGSACYFLMLGPRFKQAANFTLRSRSQR